MKRNASITKSIPMALATVGAILTSSSASAQTAGQFAFSTSRPRLVVLLHGVTPKIAENPEQQISYPGHARHYWGYRFIKGLQGRLDEDSMRVVTPRSGNYGLRIRTNTENDWKPLYSDVSSTDLAPIFFPMSPLAVPANMEMNDQFVKEYIKLTTKGGANSTMVMVNTRDGSKHLMPQVEETINEVFNSYVKTFSHLPEAQQPQIYLLGHSFGGVIARAILANPEGADLFGNKLTFNARLRADYLRKRVVLVQTIAAPHEGTMIGDPASDFAAFIRQHGYTIIYNALNNYNFWQYRGKTQAEIRGLAKSMVKTALDAVSGERDCLQDLLRIKEYNQGILRPDTATRVPGGALVPIYTAAGRNPGSTFFDQSRSMFILGGNSYNPVSVIDLLGGGHRGARESASLYLIERLLHEEGYGALGKKPWGNATNPHGDRVSSPFKGIGPTFARSLSAGWYPTTKAIFGVADALVTGAPYKHGLPDGEWDNDGFLAFDSAHALNINAPNYFRIIDPIKYSSFLPWDNDNHGSIMFNAGVGAWIHNEVIRPAGPWILNAGQRRSVWSAQDMTTTPASGVKLEILQLKDYMDNLDYGSDADFTLRVRMGATTWTTALPEDTGIVNTPRTFTLTNYASQIMPIRIDVIERDEPYSPDDICVMSPTPGQTSLYLYVDMRTGRITGDSNFGEGEIKETIPFWVAGSTYWETFNRVSSKIRITRTGVTP